MHQHADIGNMNVCEPCLSVVAATVAMINTVDRRAKCKWHACATYVTAVE